MRLLSLFLFCLFLWLPGCGNKGPLQLPQNLAAAPTSPMMTTQPQTIAVTVAQINRAPLVNFWLTMAKEV